ncbi:hypothetical protein RJ639_033307 [Escallonia herrerae]|uniref:RING-type domain-containing protein n=1 Tax=Escallonia herrerae TaxID=1293975 RepID=A0AA89BEU0_9ASTE|nr:hypothetical protein RJ639_033307 [Escallonia herrerae]
MEQGPKPIMGLSPYQTPSDAGVLCIILVNTAISISVMKEIVRSILHVVGIRITSREEYSIDNSADLCGCRGSPSETYMEEFRNRTPALRYDSVYCRDQPKQECPVCLTEFKPDAEINHLCCGHVFHKLCLEKWLKFWNVTCPLCRNHMMPQEEEADTCPIADRHAVAGQARAPVVPAPERTGVSGWRAQAIVFDA